MDVSYIVHGFRLSRFRQVSSRRAVNANLFAFAGGIFSDAHVASSVR
jgi:hypothetical protein